MPVFEFTQREVTTHRVIIRADSEEAAAEYVGSFCDDEFADSETEWDDETTCEEVSEDTEYDEDISSE